MKPGLRNALIGVAAVAVAFGGGAGWQYTQARQAREALDAARQERTAIQRVQALEQLEATLAMATVAAQFGNFERGRQLASHFFDLLQKQASAAPEPARPGLDQILARRDGVITILSRREPESGPQLAAVLTSLQRALGRELTLPADQQPDSAETGQE